LEGGYGKWIGEGRPVTQDYPAIEPKNYPAPSSLNDVRADLEEVKKVVDGKLAAILIDVRTMDLYMGEKGPWKRKGHIKGSLSHFWGDDLKEDGTWKSKEELRKIYDNLGVTPDKLVIVSCGQGQMSAHAYFTLRYLLGHQRVKNYDGSFNQWSNIDSLPIETGMK
jgi:thiosulfate/3-mercaptopyruvate sulfurtransferase